MNELKKVSWKKLKSICDQMYCDNEFQTPYQSWEFLNYVGKGFQLKNPFQGIAYRMESYLYLCNAVPRCVLPLEVNHIIKTIRMRGYSSSIGHLDFIYPKDFKAEEYNEMISLLSERYKGYSFIFDRISEKSLTFLFSNDIQKEESECVLIPIEDTWEKWINEKVGPNTRRNLRRAYRDLERDGFAIRLEIIDKENKISSNEWSSVCELFAERSCVHNGLNPKIWKPIIKVLKSNDPIARALLAYSNNMMSLLYFNDELAAFGCGVKSNDGRFISMRHGVNMKFKDYQIGLIYTSEVVKRLSEEQAKYKIVAFDRSRGAEQHKLGVGGIIHRNYHWILQL